MEICKKEFMRAGACQAIGWMREHVRQSLQAGIDPLAEPVPDIISRCLYDLDLCNQWEGKDSE